MKKIIAFWFVVGFLALVGILYTSINYAHNPIKTGDDIQITAMNGTVTTTLPLAKALITIQGQLMGNTQAILENEKKLGQAVTELQNKVNALEHK